MTWCAKHLSSRASTLPARSPFQIPTETPISTKGGGTFSLKAWQVTTSVLSRGYFSRGNKILILAYGFWKSNSLLRYWERNFPQSPHRNVTDSRNCILQLGFSLTLSTTPPPTSLWRFSLLNNKDPAGHQGGLLPHFNSKQDQDCRV